MIFNAAAELPKAGLTPNENGEYNMGLSEMARLSAYMEQKQRDRELDLDRDWMDFDE